jgi:hypothetical protein
VKIRKRKDLSLWWGPTLKFLATGQKSRRLMLVCLVCWNLTGPAGALFAAALLPEPSLPLQIGVQIGKRGDVDNGGVAPVGCTAEQKQDHRC